MVSAAEQLAANLNFSALAKVLLDPAGHRDANEWLDETSRYLLSEQRGRPR